MSAFVVKLIALVSMVVDHTTFYLGLSGLIGNALYIALRAVGRMAFPIYCFMLVNGFSKTSDSGRYLSRMTLFAALSQIPYSVAFSSANYSVKPGNATEFFFAVNPFLLAALTLGVCVLWFFFVRRDASLLYPAGAVVLGACRLRLSGVWLFTGNLNVFYTLSLALAAMCVISKLRDRGFSWYGKLLCAAALVALAAVFGESVDYGLEGLALLLLLYLCRGSRPVQAVVIFLWCSYTYLYSMFNLQFAVCAVLSLVPIILYTGERGRPFKIGFYLVYPIHLAILAILTPAVLL